MQRASFLQCVIRRSSLANKTSINSSHLGAALFASNASVLSVQHDTRNYSTHEASGRNAGVESPASKAADEAISHGARYDWSRDEIGTIFNSPLMDLVFHGARVHRHFHPFRHVQQCTLLSIKTGGCSEDCGYCPQSSKYDTSVSAGKLLEEDVVLSAARKAKEAGSTRFCMGAAWRDTIGRKTQFNKILNYVQEIRSMGMEVCCTLGMIEESQAKALKEAGLSAYNHNLDTSPEFYPNVITTRTYEDRLRTLELVRQAGISVCSGGIIGMGESQGDRIGLLHSLSTLPSHPESVPINSLVAVKGTPMENLPKVPAWDVVRMVGTARILMPSSMVRLSAGRVDLSASEQALCFMAGANSIFTGDTLLTTPNNEFSEDKNMFSALGLEPLEPFSERTGEKEESVTSTVQVEINAGLSGSSVGGTSTRATVNA